MLSTFKQQRQRTVWGEAGIKGIAQLGMQGKKERMIIVHSSSG